MFVVKRLLVILAVGSALFLLAWGYQAPPVPVELATASRGQLSETVDGEAKTRVVDRYVVSAPLAGRLTRIALRTGDSVEAGAAVGTIQPVRPPLLDARSRQEAEWQVRASEAERARSEAAMRSAESTLEFANREWERQQQLRGRNASTLFEWDRARLEREARSRDLQAARSAVEAARSRAAAVRALLSEGAAGSAPPAVAVTSPISGRVLRVFQESSTVVTPALPLLEVGDLSRLEIVADLLSSQAVRIRPGATALVERWGGTKVLAARVTRIEPSGFTKLSALGVEEQRVNVIAEFDPGQPDVRTLGDGYRVELRVVVWESAGVLRVPGGALFRLGQRWAAFAVAGGVSRRRVVEVGHRGDRDVEILSGLAEGEQVVLHPSEKLEDGVAVVPAPAGE